MAEFRAATAEQQAFLAELLDAGLLIASGVPGVYGRSSAFEDVRDAFDEAVTRVGGRRRRRAAALSADRAPDASSRTPAI